MSLRTVLEIDKKVSRHHDGAGGETQRIAKHPRYIVSTRVHDIVGYRLNIIGYFLW